MKRQIFQVFTASNRWVETASVEVTSPEVAERLPPIIDTLWRLTTENHAHVRLLDEDGNVLKEHHDD